MKQRKSTVRSHHHWKTLTVAVLWSVIVAGGCLSGEGTWGGARIGGMDRKARATDPVGRPVLRIEPDSKGFDAAAERVSMAGAIGETISFDLRFRAGQALGGVDVTVSRLRSSDDSAGLPAPVLYRVLEVGIDRRPGWYIRTVDPVDREPVVWDVVVPVSAPRGGLPTPLEAGQSLRIFAELHVPAAAAPGAYHGRIRVVDGGRPVQEVPLDVTVWPIRFPASAGPLMFADLDARPLFEHHVGMIDRHYSATGAMAGLGNPRWGPALESVLGETVALLRRHWVTPVLTGLRPIVSFDRDQSIRVDWSDFDRVIGRYLQGPDPVSGREACWYSISLDDARGPGGGTPDQNRPRRTQFTEPYLRACGSHFADLGWLDQVYVPTPPVELGSPDGMGMLLEFAETVRASDPRLRIVSNAVFQGSPPETWRRLADGGLADALDVWCLPARFCDSSTPLRQTTWMRVDHPPYSGTLSFHAPESYVRVIPWQAHRYGIGAVQAGRATNWPVDDGPVSAARCIAFDDSVLLYPGTPFGLDGPVASMRLKRLRRGMQDLAYLKLLGQVGLEHIAETLTDAVAPYALTDAYRHHYADPGECGWVQDPELWEMARRIMADELLLSLSGDQDQPLRQDQALARWRRFINRTRTVKLSTEGVRVRPTSVLGSYRVECSIRLENRTRRPVEGYLSFAKLPIGWSVQEEELVIAPIEPMTTRRVTLVANAAGMSWGADGAMHLLVLFRTRRGYTHRATARLAYITSQACPQPPILDGDLSDWAGGAGNTASGFVPITGQRPPEQDRRSTDRGGVTRCMVTHDDTNLYFGLHSLTPGLLPEPMLPRNTVRYQDMVPVDGELVEILIDPLNAGTHAAEDLYHIVIKRSGAAVFEHGINIDPAIGPRSVWPADIRYAVVTTDEGWTVELSVPRDAFEFNMGGPQIWGINFTRFDAAGQAYSTWSGAVRNAYDPASLGNLMLP